MSALRPTRAQLELLADVSAGRISHDRGYDYNWRTSRGVTASMRKLAIAGWVYLDDAITWQLTEEGRAVLDSAP